MLSFDILIYQAMILIPEKEAKKRFYVEVQSDEKIFRTDEKQGNNPNWNHKDNITSKSGVLSFTLFQKSGFLGKDTSIGSFTVNVSSVNHFKIRKNMDLENTRKEKVGTLEVNIKMKTKAITRGNKREQGNKYEIQTEGSDSISLEEEEYEEEDLEEEPEIDQYNQAHYEEENMKRMHQNEGSNFEEQEANFMPNVPGEHAPYDQRDYIHGREQQYEEFAEGDMESDEDPIPDDEDKGDFDRPSSRNPEYMSDINSKKRSRNQVIPKNNFRSTSDKDKRLNIHKKAFKSRKTSNKHFMKDSMTPINFGSKSRASRNNVHNMSHALTQYSPSSFKEQRLLEKRAMSKGRKKYKSKGRILPSKSYGHGIRMHSRFPYGYSKRPERNNVGMYTPLVGNYIEPRFSTFDNDFGEESEQDSQNLAEEMYTQQYIEYENEQRIHELISYCQSEKEKLMKKYKEFTQKQNKAIQMFKQVTKEREVVEKERLKIQIIKKEISHQIRVLKKKIDHANKLGLNNNSAFLKNIEAARHEGQDSDFANDNLTTEHAYTDMGDGSPLPSMNRQGIRNNEFHQNMSELYDQNIQKKFTEGYDVPMGEDYDEGNYRNEGMRHHHPEYNESAPNPYQDNYNQEEEFPPKNSSRNLTKEFNQEVDENSHNYNENLNRSYESEQYPSHAQTQQISTNSKGKMTNGQNDFKQNLPRNERQNYNDPSMRYPEERKSRFNDPPGDQNPYLYEMQRSQERQHNFNNQNFGNNAYDMPQYPQNKSPIMYMQKNMQMQPQYIQQEMSENMGYNGGYQQVSFMGGPYGEMSFHKDFPNPNNLMSGSSTDRVQNKGNVQGLHNYISGGGNPISTNGQNSAYSSVPGGQDGSGLSPHPMQNKEYSGNPPTFHPFHQLANSSQLNSQNSSYAPTQITPKQGISNFNNFDNTHSQMVMNSSNGVPYEKYREFENQNSFSTRDRPPAGYGDLRESVNENSNMDQRLMPNQISVITGTQDSRGFNSIREQNEQEEFERMPQSSKEMEKEDLIQKIQEYQRKLEELSNKPEEKHPENTQNSEIKILQQEEENKLSIKTDLERYITHNKISQESTKRKEDEEEIRDLRKMDNLQIQQTPERRMPQDNTGKKQGLPTVPTHITGSMKKIRNSPPLADNERMEYMQQKEHEDSPNSIIPNHYNEEHENTACRVGQPMTENPNVEVDIQDPYQEEEDNDMEFKPDPDLLSRLNKNMENNDRRVVAPEKSNLTEEQKKKIEEREKFEKERAKERALIFELMNNNVDAGFWGGYSENEDQVEESEDHEENISINSVTKEYQNTRKEEEIKEEEHPQLIAKDLNTENYDHDGKLHHSSINGYGSQVQGNNYELEDLEFVDDPLIRKKRVNEVINRVQLNLIQDDEASVQSESCHASNQNTIDDTRKYILKQQLKKEISKRVNHS